MISSKIFELFAIGDVGVDLGCCDLGVSKHLLNTSQVRSVTEEVSGKGVSKGMGCDRRIESCSFRMSFDDIPDCLATQGASASREKKVVGADRVPVGEGVSRSFEIAFNPRDRFCSDRNDSFLAAFAEDAQGLSVEYRFVICSRGLSVDSCQGRPGQAGEFAGSESAGVENLENRAVPDFDGLAQKSGCF